MQPNDSYFCKNDNLIIYIFIFEFKSWALVVFHEICSEATQRIETWKDNSQFNQCFNQFKEQKTDGENRESVL